MRYHFVAVPVSASQAAEAELNRFLASHKVLAVDRELVHDGPRSLWALCVTYTVDEKPNAATPGPSRVDYRAVLPAAQFAVFAELRKLRKHIAGSEGVPPYAIFNNEQLAQSVTGR